MGSRRTLLGVFMAGILASAAVEAAETMVRLTVPKRVAAHAARWAAGDASAVPPILVLEGVELTLDEPLEITVLGPPPTGGGPAEILAITGMVGSPHAAPPSPLRKITMPIPLNEEAAKLLADRSEVTLTLRVTGRPGRPPLKFDRAFFREP
jgi:hypothetical protein